MKRNLKLLLLMLFILNHSLSIGQNAMGKRLVMTVGYFQLSTYEVIDDLMRKEAWVTDELKGLRSDKSFTGLYDFKDVELLSQLHNKLTIIEIKKESPFAGMSQLFSLSNLDIKISKKLKSYTSIESGSQLYHSFFGEGDVSLGQERRLKTEDEFIWRVAIGSQYQIDSDLSVNLEIGTNGGPLMIAGIVYKGR